MPLKRSQPDPTPDSFDAMRQRLLKRVERVSDDKKWLEKPVSPKEFMFGKDFMNDDSIWPAVADDLIELFSGDDDYSPIAQLVVDCEGIGSGKSTKVSLIVSYLTYRLLLMRNPFKWFGLKSTTIAFMNMAPSADNAKRVVFNKIMAAIDECKWFKETNNLPDPTVQSVLRFYRHDLLSDIPYIEVVPGNSSRAFPAGADMFGGIIDEAALPGGFETAKGDQTEGLFNALNDRRKSRFLDEGVVVLISSAGTEERFMEKILVELEEKYGNSCGVGDWRDLKVLYRRRPLFDVDPRLKNDPRFEHVVVRELPNKSQIEYKLAVPERYRQSLINDKYRFLRDLCAIPTSAEHPWIEDWEFVLAKLNTERADPHPDKGAGVPEDAGTVFRELPEWFTGNKQWTYYAHIDIGTGSGKAGESNRDACGIAVGHVQRYIGGPRLPEAHIDLSIRLKGKAEEKLDPQEPFEFLAKLQRLLNFRFGYVTYDGWWGYSAVSPLTKLGIKVEHSPVTRDAYDSFWETLVDDRINWFQDWWALRELKSLEEKGQRIEKSIESTDDEIECVVKVVEHIIQQASKRRAIGTSAPSAFGGSGGSGRGGGGRAIPRVSGRGRIGPHIE